jgi:predicted DNA-binding transcriptional regulator YafY
MRRADRLFQIIQILRRFRRPVTAEKLSAELQVSVRSIYRDVRDLISQGVPIRGEAGVGYVLDRVYDMPPLMLNPEELEAAVLGVQWVAERGDPALASAARDLLSKISSAVPERLRIFITEPTLGTPPNNHPVADGIDLARTRSWIRHGRKLQIQYRSEDGSKTERVIWPVIIGYADSVRLLAAWCELRQDFRHFRTDRITQVEFLDQPHGSSLRELKRRWQQHMQNTRGIRVS